VFRAIMWFVMMSLLFSAQPAAACDPAVTPMKEVLARRDLSFVVGRYSADGVFLVEEALGGAVSPHAYHLFERGPFGSQCEVSLMAVSSPTPREFARGTRFLLPVENENAKRRQLMIVMGYPYRLVVKGDKVIDQYFGTSTRLSDLKRVTLSRRRSSRP